MKKQYLNYAGLKRVLKHLLPPIDARPTCSDTDGNLVKGQKIVELTREQYDALTVKDPETYYMINDDLVLAEDFIMLGAVQGFLITPTSPHWLLADGSTVDATLHPRLAAKMPTLPDLRESTLVGAGQNTKNTIAAHDVYDVGQFRDDQLQQHTHSLPANILSRNGKWESNGDPACWSGNSHTNGVVGARVGTTTHGKQTGVLYYVWAD